MCDVNPRQRELDSQLMAMGIKLLGQALTVALNQENLEQSVDVHQAALTAYKQGKITKAQYIRVLDALDEPDWVRNGTKPPTHPMIARLIRDAQLS